MSHSKSIRTILAAFAATAAVGLATPAAEAEIRWADPPACVEDQWARDGDRVGHYSKAGEETRVIEYGGVRETQYIWVFYVEVVNGYGMVPGGRAEKLCGAHSVPTTA